MGGSDTDTPPIIVDDDLSFFMDQLDGNISLNSTFISTQSCENEPVFLNQPQYIPIQIGNRPTKVIYERPLSSKKTIRRDNKKVQALTLPKLTNYNVRALFPKIGNFALDMKERESDISFLTEVWEKKEKKKHQHKLEELLELSGIKYISTPRPGAQRGGGAAIAVRQEKFTIAKLNIPLPRSAEVVWGLLKAKVVSGKITTIIVCCFYSPPRSRKNNVLIDHLTVTLQSLLKMPV